MKIYDRAELLDSIRTLDLVPGEMLAALDWAPRVSDLIAVEHHTRQERRPEDRARTQ